MSVLRMETLLFKLLFILLGSQYDKAIFFIRIFWWMAEHLFRADNFKRDQSVFGLKQLENSVKYLVAERIIELKLKSQ